MDGSVAVTFQHFEMLVTKYWSVYILLEDEIVKDEEKDLRSIDYCKCPSVINKANRLLGFIKQTLLCYIYRVYHSFTYFGIWQLGLWTCKY